MFGLTRHCEPGNYLAAQRSLVADFGSAEPTKTSAMPAGTMPTDSHGLSHFYDVKTIAA